ncbi:MAG TPA: glycosyltransferase [Methylotenera sp.]|nr:glycosyltransferase [Methylotenera sp.]
MRVCLVLASANNGGLEKHVRELSNQLVSMGHQVIVIAPNEFLTTLSKEVEAVSLNCNRSRYNPLLLLELLFKLRAAKSDIIHAQANKAVTMVGLLKAVLACPIVATIHNIKSNIRPFLRFKHVISVSKQLAQSFKSHPVSVIYNGIHQPNFHKVDLRETFSLPAEYPVICAVGRLVEAKGFDLLLEAVNGLPVSLVIVGDGPEQNNLEGKIKNLGSTTCYKLLGYRSDINDLIHSSDGLVISSRREGFSYVFNEALLCGTKVLSTNVPVANEVLSPELIVPINDVDALRSKMMHLLDKAPEWEALMVPARTFAQHHMNIAAMTEKTVTLYQNILNAKEHLPR